MTMPEESGKKTEDTDQALPGERDRGERSPDTRREMEAELQDAMEKADTDREDFEQS
ncbi:hypothetical protein [Streptomonospora wellingtoniae]|uniref:Nucleotide exchange factor GrpE n=1 Tax=Streptomonospora wellingtoniae TaxID=3075544 RepID=A0ABU2KRH1_9ACTN|nr:hypothetical protein [Streptomonospora sp. DSM 45055]MDT0301891.1 hypothetical protein [Streptomonospora sp. DSM 45055]